MHIPKHINEKKVFFCQNVPDTSCFNRMCLGTWFPIPVLYGGLIARMAEQQRTALKVVRLLEVDNHVQVKHFAPTFFFINVNII